MTGEVVTEYEWLGRWEITEMEGNGLIAVAGLGWQKMKSGAVDMHRPDGGEEKGETLTWQRCSMAIGGV